MKVESEIAATLFSPGHIPIGLSLRDVDRVHITVSMFSFSGLYILLLFYANNIMIISLLMFVIACIDLRTRHLINKKIAGYFSDEGYAPRPDEIDYEIIQKRRAVVKWFLFEKPHLFKEAGRIIGCAVALGAAILAKFTHTGQLNSLAYVVLIGTLLINEVITLRWRFERDSRLKAIALQLLNAIYEITRNTEASVIVSDLTRALGLSEKDARDASQYLSDKGLINTSSTPYAARISSSGTNTIKQARQHLIAKQAGRTFRNITEGVIAGLIVIAFQSGFWQFVGNAFARLFGG